MLLVTRDRELGVNLVRETYPNHFSFVFSSEKSRLRLKELKRQTTTLLVWCALQQITFMRKIKLKINSENERHIKLLIKLA